MPRPSSTARTMVAKLSSSRTRSATSRLTSEPRRPMATPTSDRFSAGASLTPSPVIATICPCACSDSTSSSFCSGLTRANTFTSFSASRRVWPSYSARSSPVSTRIPGMRVLTGEDLAEYEGHTLRDALNEVNVFARVRPEQKLLLVESLQAQGQIVAMTGDGVNDAPALKRSDVGVAMGRRGSDVSREVADLVLLDDNFATIVRAVEEGRGIYENIQKFLRFLFSTNLSEVLLVAGGAVVAFAIDLRDGAGGLMLPLAAAQILWINLLTDGLPALALAFDRTPGVMQQRPRPAGSPLLDQPSVRFVVAVGIMKAVFALALLGALPAFGYSLEVTRAAAFHFMAIGQLFLTYPSRHTATRPLSNGYLHAAVLGGIGIQFLAASLPFVSNVLGRAAIPPEL